MWIVSGYLVVCVGSIINFFWQVSNGYLGYGFRGDVELIASVFSVLANFAGWWFLSQIMVETTNQRPLIRKALRFLMLQSLLVGVSQLLVVYALNVTLWPVVALWAFTLGSLITAIGFFMMLRIYSRNSPVDDDETAVERID